jgi:hypothetical protein
MGMRKYDAKRKEKNLRKKAFSPRENAQKLKAQHDKEMKGKKTILVPHPTQPRCWIQKIVK